MIHITRLAKDALLKIVLHVNYDIDTVYGINITLMIPLFKANFNSSYEQLCI